MKKKILKIYLHLSGIEARRIRISTRTVKNETQRCKSKKPNREIKRDEIPRPHRSTSNRLSMLASRNTREAKRGTVVNIYLLRIRGGRRKLLLSIVPLSITASLPERGCSFSFPMLTRVHRASDPTTASAAARFIRFRSSDLCPLSEPSPSTLSLDRSTRNAPQRYPLQRNSEESVEGEMLSNLGGRERDNEFGKGIERRGNIFQQLFECLLAVEFIRFLRKW